MGRLQFQSYAKPLRIVKNFIRCGIIELGSRFASSLNSSSKIRHVESVKQYLAKIGRKGGKNRVKNQSAQERQESARRAAQARWAKVKKEKS